jgi:hypothetical protein
MLAHRMYHEVINLSHINKRYRDMAPDLVLIAREYIIFGSNLANVLGSPVTILKECVSFDYHTKEILFKPHYITLDDEVLL